MRDLSFIEEGLMQVHFGKKPYRAVDPRMRAARLSRALFQMVVTLGLLFVLSGCGLTYCAPEPPHGPGGCSTVWEALQELGDVRLGD